MYMGQNFTITDTKKMWPARAAVVLVAALA